MARGDVAVAGIWVDHLNELEKDRSRYDLVFRATRDAVWEWDVTTERAWWNQRQYEILGYHPETTKPSYEAWVSRVHPEDRDRVVATFNDAVASGVLTWEDEYRFLRVDGSLGTTQDRGYIERDEQGNPLRMVGVMRDVTEQRAASQALAESEERFRQLTSAIDQVFWLTNTQGSEIYYVSPAYEKIWGRSCQSAYDDSRSFTQAIHEDDLPQVLAHLPSKTGYDIVYRIRRPDGQIAWIRDRAFNVIDAEGNPVRVAGVATDITAQRNLEEQLLQSRKIESIGRLAGGVAHDFNNLLSVILSSTEFAMRDLPASSHGDLQQIRDAAERAAELTSQLLSFARRQVVAPRLLDLNELAKRMHDLLRRVIGEQVELETALAKGLYPVLADPGQLEQVLLNLAVNARDAMPDGGRLTIETKNLSLDQAYVKLHANVSVGDYVMLAVSDTGTGIAPDVLEHIFEPFFTTKMPGRGTGLGLATCYGAIRQAGGQILVYSEPGRGTTFKILLPRASGDQAADRTKAQPERLLRGTETVLVVEDDALLRSVAVRILREHGYEVLEARSGREALDVVRVHAGTLHLLLTDVVMPNMNGVELARRLTELRPGLPVLYTSGYTENTIVHHGVLEPNVAFLPKPYVAIKLLTAVRAVLDKGNTGTR
ncbi:MAG TPA: PAS domain-containing protein [Polyangiaceae bacterium]|nr:PAS domain-containing protein [Polyangiaceae bacterium]